MSCWSFYATADTKNIEKQRDQNQINSQGLPWETDFSDEGYLKAKKKKARAEAERSAHDIEPNDIRQNNTLHSDTQHDDNNH
jgi:hypothetical protein